MIGLLQRVQSARVEVAGEETGAIGPGLLVLVGVEKTDDEYRADRLLERLLGYRVFEDAGGRMNRSLRDTGGGLLLLPQFTLVADTRKGTRPSFSSGADPDSGRRLFGYLLARAESRHPATASGRFGVDMQVHLVNDGPVTFWLQV